MRPFPTQRLVALLAVMLLAFTGIVVRLASLQGTRVQDGQTLAQYGLDHRLRTVPLPAERGAIRDRHGAPLAISLDARDVYANPELVTDPEGEAEEIAAILHVKPKTLLPQLTADGTFAYLARQVDEDVAARIEELRLPGIGFLSVPKRYYPAGSLGAQVLGFVGVDGIGLAGLEQEWDAELAGIPGERTAEVAPNGLAIAQGEHVEREPVDGVDLITTLDRQIQYRAQQALAAAVAANHAKAGTIVVLDPKTGDIYAMASVPGFDANRFAEVDPDVWRNRAITDAFEPGSVLKVVTAAAALETGTVSMTERFQVPDAMKIDEFTIHDSHPHPVQTMTLSDIIAQSSNIGIAKVAERMGGDRLDDFLRRFGFGEGTGVGFPGESRGVLPALDDWTASSVATFSYGQGMTVTPLQMASVYATIANGGVWVQPRLVRATRLPDGEVRSAPPPTTRRVLDEGTADLLTQMLALVVADGTGTTARVQGYQVAGKTGTALKPEAGGGYAERYVASFIGFLPASAPRLVIAGFIDEPTTIYGSIAAGPLFQQVARFAIQRLGIAPAPDVTLPPHLLDGP
jgi:cell division protein FtsI (penicillin-binding protein 3)